MVAPIVGFGTCTMCPRPIAHRKGLRATLFCGEYCRQNAYWLRHPEKEIRAREVRRQSKAKRRSREREKDRLARAVKTLTKFAYNALELKESAHDTRGGKA